MRWCSRDRERQRNESPHEREQKQKSGGQTLHVLLCESEPRVGASIEQNHERAQAWVNSSKTPLLAQKAREKWGTRASLLEYEEEKKMDCGSAQALPLILAHHQRTPTNRKRQSLKNSGGLPSKAWPMNWRIHPITNSPSASEKRQRPHTRGMGGHETPSHHRREYLQASAFAAAGAPHHPPPSRALGRFRLSRRIDRSGDSGTPKSPAGGGCLGRAPHRSLLQSPADPRTRGSDHARGSSPRPLGR